MSSFLTAHQHIIGDSVPYRRTDVMLVAVNFFILVSRYRAMDPELIPEYRQSARCLQVALSHLPGGRLPLLSARPAVTFPVKERHCQSVGTKLCCLVTEAHAREQLAQGCYLEADRPRFEPVTVWVGRERCTVTSQRPPRHVMCSRVFAGFLYSSRTNTPVIARHSATSMTSVCLSVTLKDCDHS